MKKIFVLIFTVIYSLISIGQSELPFEIYDWEVAKTASPDTVMGISFEKLKLDSLPNQLSQFKELRYLNLSKNKLIKIPDFIANFSKLEELDLEKNRLEYFPLQICRMPQLKILRIGKNYFESLPECIEGAISLEYLDLYDTAVQKIPNSLQNLKNLREIDFTGIRFGPTFQDYWITQLKNVKLIFDPPCACMEK